MVKTNKDGQALGRKGAESRTRLLTATRTLIDTVSADKLTASGIARTAGLASQTFYLYFKDVDEALLCLIRDAADDTGEILAELDLAWEKTSLDDHADRFVSAFYRYWDRNRTILTIRNFRAECGQENFVQIRDAGTMPIVQRLAERMGGGHVLPERDALARAIIIVAAIERMASRYASHPLLDNEDLKRAEAYILKLMLLPPG